MIWGLPCNPAFDRTFSFKLSTKSTLNPADFRIYLGLSAIHFTATFPEAARLQLCETAIVPPSGKVAVKWIVVSQPGEFVWFSNQ